MKLLLFGGSGQLGYDLRVRAEALNFDFVAPVQTEIDICNREQVSRLVSSVKPDVIINAAAYTNVDRAEQEPDQAYAVNRDGVAIISEVAKENGARLTHISTDYVFDGALGRPLSERDAVNPLNVYGKSKLEGEQAALNILDSNALVIRTAWLHGSKGTNFVQTMIRVFGEQQKIRIVADQVGSPTWSGWLAEVILDLTRIDCNGVIHAACSGAASWYDVASEVLNLTKESIENAVAVELLPQTTVECGRPAQRPLFSVLDCSRLADVLGREPISWQDGIKAHLKELGYNVD